MKKMTVLIISGATILVAIILFQSLVIMPINKTEEQKYTIIKKYNDFEIRFYPSATIATITSNAKTYKDLASPGFRKLAGYIFGGNDGNKKIAMTSPVHMDINDSLSSMSFVMPADCEKKNLPLPNDSNIIISNTAAEFVAVIKFGGYASDKDMKVYALKLQKLLKENGISSIGSCRFLGYNPPFQFICRKNEIIINVEWLSSN